jgi:hypothetical protein
LRLCIFKRLRLFGITVASLLDGHSMEFRFSRHAQLILDAISEGPLTLTQLSDKVFKRNLTHAQIDEAMREIAEFIDIEKQKTAGRDAVLVSLKRQL